MRILAFDAAGKGLSVAVVEPGRVLAEAGLNVGLTHSQRLLPMVQSLLLAADIRPETLDAVAVTNGPGSFTGLRIGLATAKGLAETWGVPLAPVSTLPAVAYAARGMGALICPMLDARRNEVYTALYDAAGGEMWPPQAMAPDVLVEKLAELQQDVILVGDAAELYFAKMQEVLGGRLRIAPPERRLWGAVGCGCIVLEHPELALDPADVQAFYLRLSEAERNRLAKEAKEKAAAEAAGADA